MAQGSNEAGQMLQRLPHLWRRALACFYYAAYQASTAMLHHSGGVEPPVVDGIQRESWSHAVTPDMVRDNLRDLIGSRSLRLRLGSELAEMYKWRVIADYTAQGQIPSGAVEKSRRFAGLSVKCAQEVI